MSGQTPSAIVLTVPEADALVDQLRTPATEPGWRRMPAHITLLFPFVPSPDAGVIEELRFFFARVDGFALTFSDVREFPGVVWLAPEPHQEIRDLTEALVRRWPECPAYGGEFAEITPHLTLARTDDPIRAEQVKAAAEAQLPITAAATSASLWLRHHDGWDRLADLPFADACPDG